MTEALHTLTTAGGLPLAIVVAATLWAPVKVGDLVTDWRARRAGWFVGPTDDEVEHRAELLDVLRSIRDDVERIADGTDELSTVRSGIERIADGLDDDRRPAGVPAPRPVMGVGR